MEKDDKGSTMIRMGVSGWMFLLVPAYPGCPGSKAVKRSLLLRSPKIILWTDFRALFTPSLIWLAKRWECQSCVIPWHASSHSSEAVLLTAIPSYFTILYFRYVVRSSYGIWSFLNLILWHASGYILRQCLQIWPQYVQSTDNVKHQLPSHS